MAEDDRQLIQATLRGDPAAFGDLVRQYQDRLLTALVHVCGTRDEAEDVSQEAFVQAYLKLASFAGGSSFYTWLYRIAFNAAITRRRKRRGEASIERTRDLSGAEPAARGEAVDGRLLRDEQAAQVQRALAQLPEEFRAVLVLREMEDCDYETIAQILEVPVGTVRSRLHRARLQMKEELTAVLENGGRKSESGDREAEN